MKNWALTMEQMQTYRHSAPVHAFGPSNPIRPMLSLRMLQTEIMLFVLVKWCTMCSRFLAREEKLHWMEMVEKVPPGIQIKDKSASIERCRTWRALPTPSSITNRTNVHCKINARIGTVTTNQCHRWVGKCAKMLTRALARAFAHSLARWMGKQSTRSRHSTQRWK